jgi:hypothetical protein
MKKMKTGTGTEMVGMDGEDCGRGRRGSGMGLRWMMRIDMCSLRTPSQGCLEGLVRGSVFIRVERRVLST